MFVRALCVLSLAALALGQSRETAWMAYNAAHNNETALVPNLAELVANYQSAPAQEGQSVRPESAAMEAVADALIQMKAPLPADTIMHLYPEFPAQTVILLSRSPDSAAALLTIFESAEQRDLWLAAGDLLAAHPTPEFRRALLEDVTVCFRILVVRPGFHADNAEGGEAVFGDYYMIDDPAFKGWPKARLYRLMTSQRLNVFAPGIHPVGYSTWETTDYRDSWEDGDATPGKSLDWRIGLIAQVMGRSLEDLPLKAKIVIQVPFSSASDFENRVHAVIETQTRAFADISGALGGSSAGLQCKILFQDDRPEPREALPEVDGKWCRSAQ